MIMKSFEDIGNMYMKPEQCADLISMEQWFKGPRLWLFFIDILR